MGGEDFSGGFSERATDFVFNLVTPWLVGDFSVPSPEDIQNKTSFFAKFSSVARFVISKCLPVEGFNYVFLLYSFTFCS